MYRAPCLLSRIQLYCHQGNTQVNYPSKRFHFPIFEISAGYFYTFPGGLTFLLNLMLKLNSVKKQKTFSQTDIVTEGKQKDLKKYTKYVGNR